MMSQSAHAAPTRPILRTFGPIAITARAKHRDNPTARQLTCRAQNVGQTIRRVSIVDNHRERLSAVNPLKTTRHLHVRKPRRYGFLGTPA